MKVTTSLFLAQWLEGSWIDFKPEWESKNNYFENAVKGEHAPVLAVDEIRSTLTPMPNNRRVIIIGHEKGNIVVFERYSFGDNGVIASSCPDRVKIGEFGNRLEFTELHAFFSLCEEGIVGGFHYGVSYVDPSELVRDDTICVSLGRPIEDGQSWDTIETGHSMRVLQVKKDFAWQILCEWEHDGVIELVAAVPNYKWVNNKKETGRYPYIAIARAKVEKYQKDRGYSSAKEQLGF